jgi:YHS domain-containing protein
MELINAIKHHYHAWQERRFLKKHGCENRAQYERRYDPDYNIRASRVKDYYHGYKHVHCITDRDHTIYFWDLGWDGLTAIHNWCKENCKDKFRIDPLRVIKDSYTDEWEINEIGGGDYYFIAFKDEQDMMWFTLRWAGSRAVYF